MGSNPTRSANGPFVPAVAIGHASRADPPRIEQFDRLDEAVAGVGQAIFVVRRSALHLVTF
ncbi:hypothetical protein [Sphingomonas sp.]|uniref:hypothetical protein n=1 Tax=Sphingomonas sp. TaxID=28214 RepID=UPI003B3A63F3